MAVVVILGVSDCLWWGGLGGVCGLLSGRNFFGMD